MRQRNSSLVKLFIHHMDVFLANANFRKAPDAGDTPVEDAATCENHAALPPVRAALVREAWQIVLREVQVETAQEALKTSSSPRKSVVNLKSQRVLAERNGIKKAAKKGGSLRSKKNIQDGPQMVPLKRCLATCIPESRNRMLQALLTSQLSAEEKSVNVLDALRKKDISRDQFFEFWQQESMRVGDDNVAFRHLFVFPTGGRTDLGEVVLSHAIERVRPLYTEQFFRPVRSFWPHLVRHHVYKLRFSLRGRSPRDYKVHLEKSYSLKQRDPILVLPSGVHSLVQTEEQNTEHAIQRQDILLKNDSILTELDRLWNLIQPSPTLTQVRAVEMLEQGHGLESVCRILNRKRYLFSDRVIRYHADKVRRKRSEQEQKERESKAKKIDRRSRPKSRKKKINDTLASNKNNKKAVSEKKKEMLRTYRDLAVEREERKSVRQSILKFGDFDFDAETLASVGNPFNRQEGVMMREQVRIDSVRALKIKEAQTEKEQETILNHARLALERSKDRDWDVMSWEDFLLFEEALFFALLGPHLARSLLPFIPELAIRDVRALFPNQIDDVPQGFANQGADASNHHYLYKGAQQIDPQKLAPTEVPRYIWRKLMIEVADLWTNTAHENEYTVFLRDIMQLVSNSARFVGAKNAQQVQALRRLAEIEPGMRLYHDVDDDSDRVYNDLLETSALDILRWPEILGPVELRSQAWTIASRCNDARYEIRRDGPGPQAYFPEWPKPGFSGLHHPPEIVIPLENRARVRSSFELQGGEVPFFQRESTIENELRISRRVSSRAQRELELLLSKKTVATPCEIP